jgi:hypothetical protein
MLEIETDIPSSLHSDLSGVAGRDDAPMRNAGRNYDLGDGGYTSQIDRLLFTKDDINAFLFTVYCYLLFYQVHIGVLNVE